MQHRGSRAGPWLLAQLELRNKAIHSAPLLLAGAFINSKVGVTPHSQHWSRALLGTGLAPPAPQLLPAEPQGVQGPISPAPSAAFTQPQPGACPGQVGSHSSPTTASLSPYQCGEGNSVPGRDGAHHEAVPPRKTVLAGMCHASYHGPVLRACHASPGSPSLCWWQLLACCGGGGRWA